MAGSQWGRDAAKTTAVQSARLALAHLAMLDLITRSQLTAPAANERGVASRDEVIQTRPRPAVHKARRERQRGRTPQKHDQLPRSRDTIAKNRNSTKITIFTKYELCNLYKIQNKKSDLSKHILRSKTFVFLSRIFWFLWNTFDIFGVFCIINCYLEYRIRILCIFLYIGAYFKDRFRHFRQTSRKRSQKCKPFSHEHFFWDFCGFVVLNGPLYMTPK